MLKYTLKSVMTRFALFICATLMIFSLAYITEIFTEYPVKPTGIDTLTELIGSNTNFMFK